MLTGLDYSRLQQFEALEKNVLKPLNKYPYDPMNSKTANVGNTGYVTVYYRYYSIPYKVIGKKIKLMYNRTKVEAFSEHELIAVHDRYLARKNTYKTKTILPPGTAILRNGTQKNLLPMPH